MRARKSEDRLGNVASHRERRQSHQRGKHTNKDNESGHKNLRTIYLIMIDQRPIGGNYALEEAKLVDRPTSGGR
jgi:hypothetical protein